MRRANEDSQESACHTIRDAFRCFIHGPARFNTDIGTIMATYVQNARNILNDDTPDFMGGRPSSVPFILPCLLLVDILPCVCKGGKKAAKCLLYRRGDHPHARVGGYRGFGDRRGRCVCALRVCGRVGFSG